MGTKVLKTNENLFCVTVPEKLVLRGYGVTRLRGYAVTRMLLYVQLHPRHTSHLDTQYYNNIIKIESNQICLSR